MSRLNAPLYPLSRLPPLHLPSLGEGFITISHGEAGALELLDFPFDSEKPFLLSSKPDSLWVKSFDFQTIAFDVGFKRLFKKPENWTLTGLVPTDSLSLHSGCTDLHSPRGNAADLLGERSSGKSAAWKSRRNDIARFFLCQKYCSTGTMCHLPHPCPEGQAVPAQAPWWWRGDSRAVCVLQVMNHSHEYVVFFTKSMAGKHKGRGLALG